MPPYGQVFCGSATPWVTRRQTVDALAQANETLNRTQLPEDRLV